jgi:predicted dithiol-disulfide oxidoreductase (DUF899 family)
MDASVLLPLWRFGDIGSVPDVLAERARFSSPGGRLQRASEGCTRLGSDRTRRGCQSARILTPPAQPAMLPTSHDAMNKAAANLNIVQGLAEAALQKQKRTAALNQQEERVMKDDATKLGGPAAGTTDAPSLPAAVDRATFQAELDRLRVREKAHTREGDAIAASRRRLPMVEVDANLALVGPNGALTLLEAFEGRRQLIAYYFMWDPGRPAPEQCEGCTFYTTHVAELSYLHSRDITYATFCQGPYDESARYRDFMAWDMPWYSAQASLDALLVGRQVGLFHLVCYLRDGERVFETYWTTRRGVEAMDYSYALMDLTVYGRQEPWEDSPLGWPQQCSNTRTDAGSPDWPPVSVWPGGRPIAQWPRLEAGRSDDLRSSAARG